MRHGNKLNHLGRKSAHRKAMISNMACSLIEHKRISTTLAKAKALRVFVEPILTKSKTDSTHSRRVVFSYLQNKDIITELFRDVAPKIAERNGGYTRIIRTGFRLGDNAEMCMIELVDFNEIYNNDKTKKTTRRSRRSGSNETKSAVVSASDDVVEAEVVETIAMDANTEAVTESEVVAEEVEVAPVAEEIVEDSVEEIVEIPAVEETVEPTENETEVSEEESPATEESNEEETPNNESSEEEKSAE